MKRKRILQLSPTLLSFIPSVSWVLGLQLGHVATPRATGRSAAVRSLWWRRARPVSPKQHALTLTARLSTGLAATFSPSPTHPRLMPHPGCPCPLTLPLEVLPNTLLISGQGPSSPGLPSSSPLSPPSRHTPSCPLFPPWEPRAASNDNRSERHRGLEKQILI